MIFDLKALDTEYSKMNYIPNSNKKASKKFKELFVLDEDIIKKFIYKKKNKNFYESLTDPEEIKVDTDIGQIARETKGEEEKKENDPEPKVTPSNEDE